MENETDPTNTISTQERKLFIYWSTGLILFFVLIGVWICYTIRQNKLTENERIQAIIESPTIPPGASYDEAPPSGEETHPEEVKVGLYLNQIPDFSVREFSWTADLYIWFEWTGDRIDPGESFELLDGNIVSKDKIDESIQGETHYARYHVIADINQFFDVSRFPLNEFVLTIGIIDPRHPVYELRYLGDVDHSGSSPRVHIVEGISLYKHTGLVKLYPYQTTFGDPASPADYQPTYSTFIYGMWLTSPGLGYYLKLFLALYLSVLIAISVFFIKPTDVDPRFGLGVGALFASVANTYIISSLLPPSGGMVMADIINAFGISVIFLTVVESILSLYLFDIEEKVALSKRLDKMSIIIFLTGFLVVNIALTAAALA
jgi:hypothetical protein